MKARFLPAFIVLLIAGSAAGHPCPPNTTHHEGMEHSESSRTAHWCWDAKEVITGPYQVFDGNKLVVEGHYIAGKQDGTWREHNPDGTKRRERTIVGGQLSGPYNEYHHGTKTTEGTYKNGKRTGTWTFWTIKGKKLGTNTLVNGNGTWREWWANGKLREEGPLVDDRKQGAWTQFHENGLKHGELGYKAGQLDGAFTEWYGTGTKLRVGTYRAGKKHGAWKVWYSNGKLQGEYEYDDDKTIRWREWNQRGRVIGES